VSITKTELKSIKALATKKGRREAGLFPAEGIRLIEGAVRLKVMPARLYFAPSILSERGKTLTDKLGGRKVPLVELAAREMRAISSTETPQGILAVFSMPEDHLAKLYGDEHRKILWCENVSDPGNLGTLARSALAFGFRLLILSGSSADIWSPKVVRSSAGAVFGLNVARETTERTIEFSRENNIPVLATGTKGKKLDYSLKKQFEKTKLIITLDFSMRLLGPSRRFSTILMKSTTIGRECIRRMAMSLRS
jgi:TrmH family RNA methyltransferase